jgi:hypothetical protein
MDGRKQDFAKVYGSAQFFANSGTLAGIYYPPIDRLDNRNGRLGCMI